MDNNEKLPPKEQLNSAEPNTFIWPAHALEYLDCLGLKSPIDYETINNTVRELARVHHPDVGGDEKLFKKIYGARDKLKEVMENGECSSASDTEPFDVDVFANALAENNFELPFKIRFEKAEAMIVSYLSSSALKEYFYDVNLENKNNQVTLTVSNIKATVGDVNWGAIKASDAQKELHDILVNNGLVNSSNTKTPSDTVYFR